MYLFQGINPSPSPFTSCFGVNLHRRPILSWVLGPSRAYYQAIPTMRLPLMYFSTPANKRPYLQKNSALQSLKNRPTRTSLKNDAQ